MRPLFSKKVSGVRCQVSGFSPAAGRKNGRKAVRYWLLVNGYQKDKWPALNRGCKSSKKLAPGSWLRS